MRNDSGALPRDEQYQLRMDEGYTQSDMEEFDRTANDKRNYVASSTERAYYMDQYKVVQPYQKNNDTVKTEQHEDKHIAQWRRET